MASPSQGSGWLRAWERAKLSVMAPGRSEPEEGRAQSSAVHEEKVTGQSSMEDCKADSEVTE